MIGGSGSGPIQRPRLSYGCFLQPRHPIKSPALPAFGLLIVLVQGSCATKTAAAAPTPNRPPASGAVTDHVVVISIDGLRPDAITDEDVTLQRLIHEGTAARVAQTILPSTTLPSHTSMLTGLTPAQHGVTWNSDEVEPSGTIGVPTVFDIVHAAGFSTAAFFAKSKFHYLERKGSLDHDEMPGFRQPSWTMARTMPRIERYLAESSPNLLFVHIGEPDYLGHGAGWMGPGYLRAVGMADEGVARVMAAADKSFGAGHYTMIVTGDHGGHDKSHGTSDPRDMTIPWIVWGEGVQAGGTLADTVHTMDTAATVLWLFGIPRPDNWVGVPQTGGFTAEAREKVAVKLRGG